MFGVLVSDSQDKNHKLGGDGDLYHIDSKYVNGSCVSKLMDISVKSCRCFMADFEEDSYRILQSPKTSQMYM